MEGRVYVCSWKRVGKRYRVWVKSRPRLAAEGDTFTEADEALWSLLITATGDGENSREYEPRAPVHAELEKFLTPALVVVIGDCIVRVQAGGEYDGPRCETCGYIGGRRTDRALIATDLESGFDAGFVAIRQPPFAVANRYIFSGEFLELLRPEERKQFTWREVVRPRRAKRAFHELLEADVTVEPIAITGFPKIGGWRCESCGFRRLPQYVGYDWPSHWVDGSKLPRQSCFAIGAGHDLELCMTAERWRELVGKRGTRGVLSYEVGIAPPDRQDKAPELRSIADIARELAARGAPRPTKFK